MRWYVSRNGETVGPVEEAQVVEWARVGLFGAMLRDEAGGPWTPFEASPFARFVAPEPTPVIGDRMIRIVATAILIGGCLAIWIYLGGIRSVKRSLTETESAAVDSVFVAPNETEVYVECIGTVAGMACSLVHNKGTETANACWDLSMRCQNGSLVTASGCGSVEPGGKTSVLVPTTTFFNFESCDLVTTSAVKNVRLQK